MRNKATGVIQSLYIALYWILFWFLGILYSNITMMKDVRVLNMNNYGIIKIDI